MLNSVTRFDSYVNASADTDMLASYLEPVEPCLTPRMFRVQVALTVAGVFSVVYKLGSDTFKFSFNEADALVVNSLYTFDILLNKNDRVNFQTSVAGRIFLKIAEFEVNA